MATMWAPKEDGLGQIISLLKESQSPDTNVQREVQQVSSTFCVFINHLCYNPMYIHGKSEEKSTGFQNSVISDDDDETT